MGGIFSSPAPPPPLPPVVEEDTTAADEAKARTEAIDRRRRGRAGTVLTSDRGLLSTSDNALRKKNLLGE